MQSLQEPSNGTPEPQPPRDARFIQASGRVGRFIPRVLQTALSLGGLRSDPTNPTGLSIPAHTVVYPSCSTPPEPQPYYPEGITPGRVREQKGRACHHSTSPSPPCLSEAVSPRKNKVTSINTPVPTKGAAAAADNKEESEGCFTIPLGITKHDADPDAAAGFEELNTAVRICIERMLHADVELLRKQRSGTFGERDASTYGSDINHLKQMVHPRTLGRRFRDLALHIRSYHSGPAAVARISACIDAIAKPPVLPRNKADPLLDKEAHSLLARLSHVPAVDAVATLLEWLAVFSQQLTSTRRKNSELLAHQILTSVFDFRDCFTSKASHPEKKNGNTKAGKNPVDYGELDEDDDDENELGCSIDQDVKPEADNTSESFEKRRLPESIEQWLYQAFSDNARDDVDVGANNILHKLPPLGKLLNSLIENIDNANEAQTSPNTSKKAKEWIQQATSFAAEAKATKLTLQRVRHLHKKRMRAHEAVVRYWQRRTKRMVFKSWLWIVHENRREEQRRQDELIAQGVLDDMQNRVKAAEITATEADSKVKSAAAIALLEKQDLLKAAEVEKQKMQQLKLEIRNLNDRIIQLKAELLEEKSRGIFHKNEYERTYEQLRLALLGMTSNQVASVYDSESTIILPEESVSAGENSQSQEADSKETEKQLSSKNMLAGHLKRDTTSTADRLQAAKRKALALAQMRQPAPVDENNVQQLRRALHAALDMVDELCDAIAPPVVGMLLKEEAEARDPLMDDDDDENNGVPKESARDIAKELTERICSISQKEHGVRNMDLPLSTVMDNLLDPATVSAAFNLRVTERVPLEQQTRSRLGEAAFPQWPKKKKSESESPNDAALDLGIPDEPELLQCLSSASVILDVLPPHPTVLVERPEPKQLVQARSKIRAAWKRARAMQSARMKLTYDVAAALFFTPVP